MEFTKKKSFYIYVLLLRSFFYPCLICMIYEFDFRNIKISSIVCVPNMFSDTEFEAFDSVCEMTETEATVQSSDLDLDLQEQEKENDNQRIISKQRKKYILWQRLFLKTLTFPEKTFDFS